MMMDNRLNKLTDSLTSQLNYRSRRQGKQTKHKKQIGSPLLKEQPKASVLIASRISSRPSTPCFNSQDNSILWQDEFEEQDSKQILIVDPPLSSQILIDEGEDGIQLQEKIEQNQQTSRISAQSRIMENDKNEKSNKSSPIFILEEDDSNLLWINSQDQLSKSSSHSSPQKNEIRIEEDEEESLQQSLYQSSRAKHLSQIQQISSFEEDEDIDSNRNSLTTSRIPISPQTIAPFFNLKQVEQEISQLQQHYWITQSHIDNNTIDYLSSEQSPQRQKHQSRTKQNKHSNIFFSFFDQNQITQTLSRKEVKPFDLSLKKTKRLKQELLPKKLNSLYELKFLIENQSNFVKQRAQEQRGTIKVFKRLLDLKIKLPQNWKGYQYSTLSEDLQIEINQLLIRTMIQKLKQ